MALRIRAPKEGFIEIAEEAEAAGEFDASLAAILRLLPRAARNKDAKRTHLLTVSLHAFLYYKGGSYPLTRGQTPHAGAAAPAAQAVLKDAAVQPHLTTAAPP